jgi:hypothetical protein
MPSNPVAWLHGDQEYYPVWPTTLWEQDQIWRTKFNLRTSEQRYERLAQEAALYVICMKTAHLPLDGDPIEDLMERIADKWFEMDD